MQSSNEAGSRLKSMIWTGRIFSGLKMLSLAFESAKCVKPHEAADIAGERKNAALKGRRYTGGGGCVKNGVTTRLCRSSGGLFGGFGGINHDSFLPALGGSGVDGVQVHALLGQLV